MSGERDLSALWSTDASAGAPRTLDRATSETSISNVEKLRNLDEEIHQYNILLSLCASLIATCPSSWKPVEHK